jgi:hypothetical protein
MLIPTAVALLLTGAAALLAIARPRVAVRLPALVRAKAPPRR